MPIVLELYSEVIQKQLCFLGEVSILKKKRLSRIIEGPLCYWGSHCSLFVTHDSCFILNHGIGSVNIWSWIKYMKRTHEWIGHLLSVGGKRLVP